MGKKIIFDFDGTLIDISERYYAVFCECCAAINISPLSKEKYLHLKRKGIKDAQILVQEYHLSSDRIINFKQYRNSILEESRYLDMDRLHQSVRPLLAELQEKKYELVLLSLRDNINNSVNQLKNLGISDFFSKVIFTGPVPVGQSHADRKYQRLVEHFLPHDFEGNYYVGDTATDIEASHKLGTKMILVGWGLGEMEKADKSKISFIVENFTDLRKILLSWP
ncbi:MAG: HAD family hydrolase [Nanoarchaeota archaeon]|nr:HAD family hydrolase [Nanoarchaeota archaeon]